MDSRKVQDGMNQSDSTQVQTTSSNVLSKFFFTSFLMWVSPLAILYGFNHQIFPGTSSLSSSWHTLLSGFLAVISVILVMGLYVFMALKEPSTSSHQPDPMFLAKAQASMERTVLERNAIPENGKKTD
jgi:hypothetical protein